MQVVLQLIALLAGVTSGNDSATPFISVQTAIYISLTIAVINVVKTVVILKLDSLSLNLSLWRYIRRAGHSGIIPAYPPV